MAFQFRADERFFPPCTSTTVRCTNFDQSLFSQGADSGGRWEESPRPAEMFMTRLDQAKGIVDARGHVYRKQMVGTYKNEDVWV